MAEGFAGAPPYGVAPVGVPSRLSPRVLLIDPVRMLPSLFLPLAGVLFVGGFSPASFGWAAMGIVGSIVFSVVRWATFTYQIVGGRLELTRSLVSRSVRTIPLERVRGVDISTPPLHRLLGLSVLRLDTGAHGGGDKQEGELNGVTVAEAERLKTVLLRTAKARRGEPAVLPQDVSRSFPGIPESRAEPGDPSGPLARPPAQEGGPGDREGQRAGDQAYGRPSVPFEGRAGVAEGGGVASSGAEEVVYARVSRGWLTYGPLSGAYLLTPFALIAGAVGLVFQWGEQLGLSRNQAWSAGMWLWERPYLLVVFVILFILAMPVAGGVMYAVFNWDFTLRARDGYLVAERGLINRRSVSLERRRVRGYEIVEGLAERWAGVMRVWAIVTGLGDSETRGQLLPVVPRAAALGVTTEAIGALGAPLRPHPPAARRRRLFRAIAPWLAVAVAGAVPALLTGPWEWWLPASLGLLLAVLGIPLGLDRYRSLGHTYDGTRLSVRSGSLRRSQAVVERRAVVGWTIRQTWFQRQAGVLTVIAGVGAGSGGYAALDVAESAGPVFAAEVTPDWLTPFLLTEPAAGTSRPE
ncbi:PH domain-containing protein [Streptosporangium soli]|nr:PH domain-containing protein [Streptosporangium sp. KLBMP 9127]